MILPKRNLHVKRVNPTVENSRVRFWPIRKWFMLHWPKGPENYRRELTASDVILLFLITLILLLVSIGIGTVAEFVPNFKSFKTNQSAMNNRIDTLESDLTAMSEEISHVENSAYGWIGDVDQALNDRIDRLEATEMVVETEPAKAAVTETTEAETANMKLIGTFKVTAYCPCPKCCGKWSGQKMWNGRYPEEGRTVGADYDVFPRGTRIYIEGVGIRTVEDTGSYTGNRLDLFFSDHQEALDWTAPNGHNDLKVWVIENE